MVETKFGIVKYIAKTGGVQLEGEPNVWLNPAPGIVFPSKDLQGKDVIIEMAGANVYSKITENVQKGQEGPKMESVSHRLVLTNGQLIARQVAAKCASELIAGSNPTLGAWRVCAEGIEAWIIR